MNETTQTPKAFAKAGRNDRCPCGSGKKYKRCHGLEPASTAATAGDGGASGKGAAGSAAPAGMPGMPPGMDGMNPEMMMQMAQVLRRLPKGQMQRLQVLMQQAMMGKDVARELTELQGQLPPEVQQMFLAMAAMSGMGGEADTSGSSAPAGGEDAAQTETKRGFFKRILKG